MDKELKALLMAVAKKHNLSTAPQLIDIEEGLLAHAIQIVREIPGEVLFEAMADIVTESKANQAPMSHGEIKETRGDL